MFTFCIWGSLNKQLHLVRADDKMASWLVPARWDAWSWEGTYEPLVPGGETPAARWLRRQRGVPVGEKRAMGGTSEMREKSKTATSTLHVTRRAAGK